MNHHECCPSYGVCQKVERNAPILVPDVEGVRLIELDTFASDDLWMDPGNEIIITSSSAS